MKLKVSSSNFYVKNQQPVKDARFLASLNCDLSGIGEGHHGNAQIIDRVLFDTHNTFWGTSRNKDIQLAMLDVPVVVDRRLRIIKRWARKLCDRSDERNIGMPRAATAVRVRKSVHKITFINVHLNAAIQNRETKEPYSFKIPRVAEYIKSMIILEAMIRNAKRRGDLVVLVGDMNFSPQRAGIWKFSPQALFKRTGLNYRVAHIDYIAFSRKFHSSNFTIISANKTGSDHPWITLELTI